MKTIYSICARTGFFFTFLLLTTSLMAQNIQVKGLVKDPAGEAIIGGECSRERYYQWLHYRFGR